MIIYTKTGDKGQTSLANGQRVAKTDTRIEAYGTVDELNSWIGALRVLAEDVQLEWIQNKLFNLGALLSEAPGEWITDEDVKQLEAWIDEMQAVVPPQRSFILPCGGEAVSRCHICRTVCRRAERKMIEANADTIAMCFINRLSDYLFVKSRWIAYNNQEEETAWKKA
jgi:cob(I)alamin adenosyltransferase